MQNPNRILIIDDDLNVQETLRTILNQDNYHLLFFSHGEQALNEAEQKLPDLILLDVLMPDIDGFEVCKQLRQHSVLKNVPIIMLTALEDKQSRLHGLEVGADDFISKPFDPTELRARIRSIMRLSTYRHVLEERTRFEWVVEQSEDAYLLLEEGDKIVYANSCARLYLKIFKDEFLEQGFWQLINQHYRLEPQEAWKEWPCPNIAQLPRYLVRPESDQTLPFWLQADVFEFPAHHCSGSQLVRLHNVSEHMNLQRQIWSFQTLVSHKLRAPLNGLVGLQMLDSQHIDLTTERARSLLKIARHSAKRLQDQVIEILNYVDSSQILKPKENLFPIAYFADLVEQANSDLNIENLDCVISDALNDKIFAFAKQGLELILRELLTNAQKFHPQQTPSVTVEINPKDERFVTLSVSDDGQNLLDDEISKVWIPYYQSEKSFTGEIKGMGLGLPMIIGLVWANGGTGKLRNRTNQSGIIVELTLPLKT